MSHPFFSFLSAEVRAQGPQTGLRGRLRHRPLRDRAMVHNGFAFGETTPAGGRSRLNVVTPLRLDGTSYTNAIGP